MPSQRFVLAIHSWRGPIHTGRGWKNAPWLLPVEMAISFNDSMAPGREPRQDPTESEVS